MIRARFSDGASAAQHPVSVYAGAAALTIVDPRGRILDTWPIEGTRLAEEVYRGRPARLVHRERPDAILRIVDHDDSEHLCKQIPGLGSRYLARFGAIPRLLFWTLVALAVVGLSIWSTPHLAGAAARFVPLSWEQALGRMAVDGLGAESCRSETGREALDRLTARLSQGYALPPLDVSVIHDEQVNAFAAPGGQIVLLSGLVRQSRTPEQLAGVLAHEIAHVSERHPMAGVLRAVGLSVVVSAMLGDISGLAALAVTVGEQVALMSYSRGDEADADALAVKILNSADIRGEDLVAFFNGMEAPDPAPTTPFSQYLASHPPAGVRALAIEKQVSGSGVAMSPEDWVALQNICEP